MELFYRGNRYVKWLCALGFIVLLASCKSENGATDRGELFIKIYDAPASLDRLNLVVNRVQIHHAGSTMDSGWEYANTDQSAPFDLLTYTNGVSFTLADSKVPVGSYDGILLVFGYCSVVESGITKTLNAPSDYFQPVGFAISSGIAVPLAFDLDVAESVQDSANGTVVNLHPKIRVQDTRYAGSITGAVLTGSIPARATISAEQDSIRIASTGNDPGTGSFQLSDLPVGFYSITVRPVSPALRDTTIDSVAVSPGIKTVLRIIRLQQQ